MPNWKEVLDEINELNKSPLDKVRRKYLTGIHKNTGRNVIAYYSGWLQKPQIQDTGINDKDKSALMVCINKLDRSKGLDLILHTPGGDIAATESIIDYLQTMFNNDVRAIVPQICMSAGTMIALSCKEIMMGKQSNLGPIDPQIGGVACQAVLDEFEKAKLEIQQNPNSIALWQVIVSKYHPTFLTSCHQAIAWAKRLTAHSLIKNMCKDKGDVADRILTFFSDHSEQKSHSRHISISECKNIGLNIVDMEDNNEVQDLILTAHHAFMHTFSQSNAIKIVENHLGVAYIENTIK